MAPCFICLFGFGYTGSSLLCAVFSSCGAQASIVVNGFSCPTECGGQSLTRNWTHGPYIGRWIVNHWTTREVPGSRLESIPLLALSQFSPLLSLAGFPGNCLFPFKMFCFSRLDQCQVSFLEHYPAIKASTWKPGFATSTRRIQSLCFSIVAMLPKGLRIEEPWMWVDLKAFEEHSHALCSTLSEPAPEYL